MGWLFAENGGFVATFLHASGILTKFALYLHPHAKKHLLQVDIAAETLQTEKFG